MIKNYICGYLLYRYIQDYLVMGSQTALKKPNPALKIFMSCLLSSSSSLKIQSALGVLSDPCAMLQVQITGDFASTFMKWHRDSIMI